ncbi:hypothetical protein L6164_028731 [Bauhinia variegata]|uniref:Uncharacterized protein n=2 Tax=Bauhinia variegata TaxID=167791 RepID=A0ACB9L763_BAUVA|nr:hypothetical protein L6164_028726 [Bauhinia variegata]KAI4305360.1 hypothetical protein L6164_028731 [Bauhinia variegata]
MKPGVGPISLLVDSIGGDYDGDRKIEDLKLLYRAYVTDSLSGGRLEDKKLAALNQLNVKQKPLHLMSHQRYIGKDLHRLFQVKLQQCVADGELSDEDVSALLRLRLMLCIPQQIVDAAHSPICGSLFEKVVKNAIASGVDGYDADVKNSVRKAAHGLRLSRETAMSIASKAVSTYHGFDFQ